MVRPYHTTVDAGVSEENKKETGKGDFGDTTKRAALGVGTITVKVSNGTNPAANVRSFTDIKLFAPAADGTTKSFSLFKVQA